LSRSDRWLNPRIGISDVDVQGGTQHGMTKRIQLLLMDDCEAQRRRRDRFR